MAGEYIRFQAISWHAEDVNDVYIIKVFGVDDTGNSVCLSIPDFKPYFYIKVPDFWNKIHAAHLLSQLESIASDSSIIQIKLLRRKDFWGFTNNTLFNFARLDFGNYESFKRIRSILEKGRSMFICGKEYSRFKVYEANIDPFIRLIHIKDIKPSGWISVPQDKVIKNVLVLPSTCKVNVECSWKYIESHESEFTAKFTIASFDIECMSSHGDFPVPIKDYRKPVQELVELDRKCRDKLVDVDRVDMVKRGMYSMFGIEGGHPSCSKVFPKQPIKDLVKIKHAIDLAADDIFNILSEGDRDNVIVKLINKMKSMGLPKLAGDEIIAIGVTVHEYGSKDVSQRYILTLGDCEPIQDVQVQCFTCEKQLLLAFRSLIVNEVDPDIITGYNINGFDFWYLHERADELGIWDEFACLGRLKDKRCKYTEQKLSSSALGDNLLKYIDMHGRVVLDVMKVVQRDHKLDSYKLDLVAAHFLGKNKHDVSPQDIFRLQRGSAADRRIIADYCVQDCALCNLLIIKLEIFANNVGMSNVCLVPLHFIFMRGQGIKIFSLVMKECKDDGFLIPVVRPNNRDIVQEDSFEGALVLEPKTGIYIDEPVSILDYASLYPSSMISENLSHDSIVLDPLYDNLPGVEYLNVTYDVSQDSRVCRFVQPINGEKGLVPRILEKLLKARKMTRKRMELGALKRDVAVRGWYSTETREFRLEDGSGVLTGVAPGDVEDAYQPFQKAVLDGLQTAYKVTANSLYGQCGARTSPIYMKDIAACTTATGRRMIIKAKEFLETNYCANIVYGDSVASYTPVYVRVGGHVVLETVERVADRWGSTLGWLPCIEDGKQDKDAIELPGVEVWSDEGWTVARRLIRHRLAPHKNMFRVMTRSGLVDVTDDHSLLYSDGSVVKPGELILDETLLHANPPKFTCLDGFMNADTDVKHLASELKPGDPVPLVVLEASLSVRIAFWMAVMKNFEWMTYATGLKRETHLTAATMYALIWSLGWSQDQMQCDNLVSVAKLPREDFADAYVYDFTTANHKFAAGVGRIVVHNTDSIFCVFPQNGETSYAIKQKGHAAILPSIQLAMQASAEFRKTIKAPHDLEYEKTFWPFILLSKKRYVGNKYEQDDKVFKQNSMGIVLKRRDNAPVVKTVYGGIIDIVLNKRDIGASVEFLKHQLERLETNQVNLQELVITKSLRSDYKSPDKIAHKVLAERMGERDPGNKPQVNERIPFVYIQSPKKTKKILQGDRIEHIDHVKKHGLKPDMGFYITNQVMNPVCQLLGIVVEQLPEYKHGPKYFEKLHTKLLNEGVKEDKAHEKVVTAREKEVERLIFNPVIMRIEDKINHVAKITDFFKPKSTS